MKALFSSVGLIAALGIVLLPADLAGQQLPPSPAPATPLALPIVGVPQAGTVTTIEATTSDRGAISGNTLNGTVQIQGVFGGSTPAGRATLEPLPLNLPEAIRRGLAYNLGVIGSTNTERGARAAERSALAKLLPDVSGTIAAADEKVSLATLGLQSAQNLPPGFQFGRVLGPFHFFDAGVVASQRVIDLTALRNYRATKDITAATAQTVLDDRDQVVLAVGGSYLQTMAAAARVDSARAQVDTAQAVYTQAVRQNEAGVNARIDVDRSQVEWQVQRLRLISLQTDFASQKLVLGRIIGLPLGQEFALTTLMEYAPGAPPSLPDALTTAFANRADLKAADAQVRAADQARKAAKAQYVPSLAVNGGYFVAGETPSQSNGVYSVFATVDFPIWTGGRIPADVAAADAAYNQRRAEYEDVRGRIDFEVRTAFLRLNATTEQMSVAESNRTLAQSTLRQARDRFAAGVADTVEVVQAQESVATAEQDYIDSLHALYLAKLSLARAIGNTEAGIATLLQQSKP
jgi:outer membrane protein TolC